MALEYYDDAIAAKLMKWTPTNVGLRVLKPDDTKRLFETLADDSKDRNVQLPLIALSRNNDIELLLNVKNPRSYDGFKLEQTAEKTAQMNVIPVKLQYQMDIYTKTFKEGDEYMRQYLFKLINNPVIKITVPYNGKDVEQIANIRVLSTVSDTSDIPQRLFTGQFTRWTIQMEIQDAFLYNIPYRTNWRIYVDDEHLLDPKYYSVLEVAENLTTENVEEREYMNFDFQRMEEGWSK